MDNAKKTEQDGGLPTYSGNNESPEKEGSIGDDFVNIEMNTELEHLSPNGLMDSPEAKISSEHSSEEKSDSKRSGSKKRVVKRIPTQTKQKMKSPNEPKHDRPMS